MKNKRQCAAEGCNIWFGPYHKNHVYCSGECRLRMWDMPLYRRNKAKGLCVKCKKRPALPGHVGCEYCQNIRKTRYRRAREAGLCCTCGVAVIDGKSRCHDCRQDQKLINDRIRAKSKGETWLNS